MKKRTILALLATLALGVLGMSFSTLYEKQSGTLGWSGTLKEVSYGYPLTWHGYEQIDSLEGRTMTEYWNSPESFLIDAAFWIAISFSVCLAAMKSVNILHKARASKKLSVINI